MLPDPPFEPFPITYFAGAIFPDHEAFKPSMAFTAELAPHRLANGLPLLQIDYELPPVPLDVSDREIRDVLVSEIARAMMVSRLRTMPGFLGTSFCLAPVDQPEVALLDWVPMNPDFQKAW